MADDELPPPEPPNMAWLYTFADLVSLLITFFVLLYSMKVVDESRWDELRGAFDGVFVNEEAVVVVHPEEFRTADALPEFPADSLPYLQNVLKTEFAFDPVLGRMTSHYDEQKDILRLTFPASSLFDSGSVDLSRHGRVAIIKLADKLRHLDNRLEVAGYTDPTQPQLQEAPTNWEFGMLRAIAVSTLMQERGMTQHVPAFSFGDSRFDEIDKKLPELKRYMLARRIEVLIYGDQGEL